MFKNYFNLSILWLGLFSACGYFARLTIASLSFVCSIILRRYYNAQLAFSTKARLRTGSRFFPPVGISAVFGWGRQTASIILRRLSIVKTKTHRFGLHSGLRFLPPASQLLGLRPSYI